MIGVKGGAAGRVEIVCLGRMRGWLGLSYLDFEKGVLRFDGVSRVVLRREEPALILYSPVCHP